MRELLGHLLGRLGIHPTFAENWMDVCGKIVATLEAGVLRTHEVPESLGIGARMRVATGVDAGADAGGDA